MARLIGLVGLMRSGKSTTAEWLSREHGFVEAAFAGPLKEFALQLNPMIPSAGEFLADIVVHKGWEAAKECPEVRAFLQALGTTLRNVDPTYWIDTLMTEVATHLSRGGSVVMSDTRYPNEALAVRNLGGWIIRIERPGNGGVNAHPSESGQAEIEADYTIVNDGTVDELHGKIDAALAALEGGMAV